MLLKLAFYIGNISATKVECNKDILSISTPGQQCSSLQSVLFIDDRMPYGYLGAGYPRSKIILQTLSKLKVHTSYSGPTRRSW